MRRVWLQGEHVVLIGATGTGKTTIAKDLLALRDYVIVLGVKPRDRTLERFTREQPKYRKYSDWPIHAGVTHALIWIKAKEIDDAQAQAARVHRVMSGVYRDGGWCLFLDDTGYITGTLKRTQDVVMLLNTARSSNISLVAAATQPTSVVARIPSETVRQPRHYIIFKFEAEDAIKSLASITGVGRKRMEAGLTELRIYPNKTTDFLSISSGEITIVRNPPRHLGGQ